MSSLDTQEKEKVLARLSRIEGQVRGLSRMIENDRYCVDVLTQVNAVRNALKKVGIRVLDSHIHGCVRHALEEDQGHQHGRGDVIEELLEVIEKFTD